MNTENNNNNNIASTNDSSAIADAIKRLGIEKIEVTFDGCGDSGQIDEVNCITKDGGDVDLKTVKVGKVKFIRGYQHNSDGTMTPVTEIRESNFEEVIEDICYNMLEKSHDGWEINEGSYGTFTFDFTTGKIHLEYKERVQSVETSNFEFDFSLDKDQSSNSPKQLTETPE
jgi:DnaJ-class molecular chaperone